MWSRRTSAHGVEAAGERPARGGAAAGEVGESRDPILLGDLLAQTWPALAAAPPRPRLRTA
ncbi:hypothetical protein ACN20G_13350 [Streptomyces sp. BI20]|uniref:hypothetical protein n=1 Tax=Streptomyces sp. BI20 TaxID=3403460 RepID=UPI003C77E344